MSRPLAGKVCLVTGGTRGIGRGIALQLGEAGGTVYVTGRTLKKSNKGVGGSLEETAEEIKSRGGVCCPVQCDHSNDDDVKKLFDRIEKEQDGRLDILVNNAYAAVGTIMEHLGQPFWEVEPDMWDKVNNVGLRNHYYCMVYACRLMVPRKQGLIVNISSPGGLKYLFNIPYGVGKCALDRLSADAAIETKKHNITCVSMWPGTVKTEMISDVVNNRKIADDTHLPGVGGKGVDALGQLFMDLGETVELAGKAIVHLAADPKKTRKTGKILMTADLADEYGFTDIDGSRPSNLRSVSVNLAFAGWTKLSKWIPSWIKVPRPLVWMASNKL